MAVLATAKIMGYSGMTQSIADFIVRVTGSFYPLVAPLIGSIGTFVTGSSTSSSVLFSKLQASTGAELNINQIWLVAANTVGSTAGKIISPQSIAVARSATSVIQTEPLFSSFLSSHLLQQAAHTAKLQFTSSQDLVHPCTSIYVPPFRYFEAINLISGKI